MAKLSYLSSLEDVIQCSDVDLRAGIGFLSPDTVIEYVFHLRQEVVTAQETQTAADAEITQLQGIIAGLQTNLGFCSAEITRLQGVVAEQDETLQQSMRMLNVSDAPAAAPPLYELVSTPPPAGSHPPQPPVPQQYGASSSSSSSPSSVLSSSPAFPPIAGSCWTWAHDGTRPYGIIEFLDNGSTKWHNGARQGYWTLKEDGRVLETEFNGVHHELKYVVEEKKAVLLKPVRSPNTQMWIQGDRGEFLAPNFSGKVSLRGAHSKHMRARPEGGVDCAGTGITVDTVYEVVQVKPKTVAFKSHYGKWLSAQPGGFLEWNRGGEPNIWEFFEVGKTRDDKITLLSYHGKYVSAQRDGKIEVNRDRALGWEQFTVLDGSEIPNPADLTGKFPSNFSGSTWTWAHNGTEPNGTIEFLPDGGVKWCNGARQGNWKLKEYGRLLETDFNGVHHELVYIRSHDKAVLNRPLREPRSRMWLQGAEESGETSQSSAATNSNTSDLADEIAGKAIIRGHHSFFVSANATCQENTCGNSEVIDVIKVGPGVVAFRSCFGKYLSAQRNGTLQWNRDRALEWEYFTVEKVNNKFAFLSHHRKYMSAQPNGGLEVNRDAKNLWELFQILAATGPKQPRLRESADAFPINFVNSVWTWAHDGTRPNGVVEFNKDPRVKSGPEGYVKWGNGQKQGKWKLKDDGKLLKTEFNGVHHVLEYIAAEKKAVLISPERNPPSQMWIQGDRGEFPFGRQSFSTSKIALCGAHNKYVQADSDGMVDCRLGSITPDAVCEVVQCKPGTVAFRSQFGFYLSAQPNGTLQWNRRGVPNIWEYFEVSRVSGDVVTLLSYHGKYVSAQPGGELVADRKRAQGWEKFKVEDGSNPRHVEVLNASTRRKSDTDHAAVLSTQGRVGLRGHHGCFVSANATCKERSLDDSELIGVVRINHNVVAFRSRFGKYLSAQPNGTLQWNRDKVQAWEHFTVEKVEDKYAFCSHHSKYMSAQPQGGLEVNRASAAAWEFFSVVTG